jgi:glycosyltransferase involved in cell wall biosynthesis
VLHGLIKGLVDGGHDVAFGGHPDSDLPVTMLESADPKQFGPMGDTPTELAHVMLTVEAATAWRPEVLHVHTPIAPLLRRNDVPTVITNHGPFDGMTTPIFERLARTCSVVAISGSHAASAPSVPVAAVVHHGLDVNEWPVGDGRGGYLLFLGRMHPDKGPHRAIAMAREAGIPIVLAAKAREQLELDFFEQHVRPMLHDDAHFVGEADADTKRRLLAGARALLNPISWPEPFGMVMVEALACGTPVITSPIGAAPEIVEDGVTGFLCSTPRATGTAIESVDRLDRAQCRESVVRRFSVERMVNGYLDAYRAAVAHGRGRPSRASELLPTERAAAMHVNPIAGV